MSALHTRQWCASRTPVARIVATTDVHSHLHRRSLFTALHAHRAEGALVCDGGDFFEGTGYYSLGHGKLETAALHRFYDILAPGNHGYRHHRDAPLRAMTIAANIHRDGDAWAFDRLTVRRWHGKLVAITAILSPAAFATIPAADRAGHEVSDPEAALSEVRADHPEIDQWVVLSHSGYAHDLALAAACPWIAVVFSGHCHSPQAGPTRVGSTWVLKAPELGEGLACAEFSPEGAWTVHLDRISDLPGARCPDEHLEAQLALCDNTLRTEIAPLNRDWAAQTPAQHDLVAATAHALQRQLGNTVDAVVLNTTCLRTTPLRQRLTHADLLTLEPYGNDLVLLYLDTAALHRLDGPVREVVGELVVTPTPDARLQRWRIATTGYLATVIDPSATRTVLPMAMSEVLIPVLTGSSL